MSQFGDVLEEMRALDERKRADYGTVDDEFASVTCSREFGISPWVAASMKCDAKLRRIKCMVANGTLANESVRESLLDLANYAGIALACYDADHAKTEVAPVRRKTEFVVSRPSVPISQHTAEHIRNSTLRTEDAATH